MNIARAFATFWLVLGGIALSGCGKGADSPVSEAFGFQCTSCNAKFYTEAGVTVMQCPDCKKDAAQGVIKYTCAKDNEIVIAPNSRGGARCSKCGSLIESGQYPNEADLKAWGASKKTKSDVGG